MPVPEISADDLAELLTRAPLLLDVRTSDEFAGAHVGKMDGDRGVEGAPTPTGSTRRRHELSSFAEQV